MYNNLLNYNNDEKLNYVIKLLYNLNPLLHLLCTQLIIPLYTEDQFPTIQYAFRVFILQQGLPSRSISCGNLSFSFLIQKFYSDLYFLWWIYGNLCPSRGWVLMKAQTLRAVQKPQTWS